MCLLWKRDDWQPENVKFIEIIVILCILLKLLLILQLLLAISICRYVYVYFTSKCVDSVDSEPKVPPIGALLKLLALRTIVATVLQYNALANASRVALH